MVDAGGLLTHVAEAGAGEPLLLLHGWPQHWYEWRHQIVPLAEHYRVICPDLRGLGWTDAPATGYEKEALAGDVLALLDALGLERVRLMGHDWGAWIGYLICMREPDRVERLLALSVPPPWLRMDAAAVASMWRLWYQWLLASGAGGWLLRHRAGVLARLVRLWAADPGALSDEDLEIYAERLARPEGARASVAFYRSFVLRETWPLLRGRYAGVRLRTPTLLLAGTDDPLGTAILRDCRRHADDLTLEMVPACGHFIPEEQPELVTRKALDFFA